uniref:NADH-ubiquinone oxidoreductase chain 2 n=1 Tax=Plexippus paykulli TaxID=243411 RepID=A0A0U1V5Q2_PLEPA|nr:NADH dehydrogenase subunit 2 [Plexippus paykulli]AIM52639.1 NADH dehydrogenase subunit 2 [Plexippus paykulli]
MVIPSLMFFMFLYLMSFGMVLGGEDWFLIWLGLEINMMSFLILLYRRYDMSVIESCMKYFFIQSLGSALLISILYGGGGVLGSMSSLILGFKIGAGPFYYWFPSVCSGLNWGSCFMLMLFQKVLPLCLIFMLIHWVIWIIISISLVMGVLGSFNQSSMSELMAYSSIHHLGWILIIVMNSSLSWMIYLMVYGFVLLSVVLLMISNEVVNFNEMFMSESKVWFVVSMLSMAGMPPLLGFFLKWMALINVISFGLFYVLALVLVSVIMLYVYLRVVYDCVMGGGVEVSWVLLKDRTQYGLMIDMSGMLGVVVGLYFVMSLFL